MSEERPDDIDQVEKTDTLSLDFKDPRHWVAIEQLYHGLKSTEPEQAKSIKQRLNAAEKHFFNIGLIGHHEAWTWGPFICGVTLGFIAGMAAITFML